MTNKLKQTHAVTLIALIITIIVLLILAGVVINMTLGNDGIIQKAQSAADLYKNAQEKEEYELAKIENTIENFSTRNVTNYQRNIIELNGNIARTQFTTDEENVVTLLTFNKGESVGNKLSYSNNGVLVGDGVSKVKIDYCFTVEAQNSTCSYFGGFIYLNGVNVPTLTAINGVQYLANLSKTGIINVKKGDLITAGINARKAGSFYIEGVCQNLIVEVIE